MEFYGKHVLSHDIISTINIVNNNTFRKIVDVKDSTVVTIEQGVRIEGVETLL